MDKKWFDQQYENIHNTEIDGWLIGIRASQSKRLSEIVNHVAKHADFFESVLDIGCGIGILYEKISKRCNITGYLGTDISIAAVDYANSLNHKSACFKQSELPEIPFSEKNFDLILLIEVLYYLSNKDKDIAIRNVINSLKPGGLLCISGSLANDNYFTESYFNNFYVDDLELISTSYHHSKYYYYFEDLLLSVIDFNKFITKSINQNKINKKISYTSNIKNFLNRKYVALFFKPVGYAFSKIAHFLIRSNFIFEIFYRISKYLNKEGSKSGIVKVFRKL